MKLHRASAAVAGIVLILIIAYAVATEPIADNHQADIIRIETMRSFGPLQRSGVHFPHDRHTKAVAENGQDCSICHPGEDESSTVQFMDRGGLDAEATRSLYHENCIGCHQQSSANRQPSGPVTCGECHQWNPQWAPTGHSVDFDPSLHYRHIEAEDGDCGACHHVVDPATEETVYREGQEAPCRFCHPSQPAEEAISFRTAAHRSCIDCHRQARRENRIDTESVVYDFRCSGCHHPELLAEIAELDEVPRLKRNQPDTTWVKSSADLSAATMDLVPFSHRQHEDQVPRCVNCHHQSMAACDSCHTLSGSPAGGGISLSQAMHDTNSKRSCLGCHAEAQKEESCAGCHAMIDETSHFALETECQVCHVSSLQRMQNLQAAGRTAPPPDTEQPGSGTAAVDLEALPEEIYIEKIAKEKKGVLFYHRDHVWSLTAGMEESRLAGAFHQGKNRICRSCHHHSPDFTDTPPGCTSCHPEVAGEGVTAAPVAEAAYHQQCFGCHLEMDIWIREDATDCWLCHEELF